MSKHRDRIRRLVSFVVMLSMLLPLLGPLPVSRAVLAQEAPPQEQPATFETGLFRTRVNLPQATSRARLDELDVVVLDEGDDWALVLVDSAQLETLAKLRFAPRASEELGALVDAHASEKTWLAHGLQPVVEQLTDLQLELERGERSDSEAKDQVRAALLAITPEQQAGIASLIGIDTDGDGLTDTEEQWWCTDPLNPNSDDDAQGYTDGEEVTALLDFTLPRTTRWGYGAPFGPPHAWPDFNGMDGDPDTPACNDGDFDTIPDYAEAYMIGTRVPAESTDHDKFDDGQEFFGVTYCPGAPTSCGYGVYPRIEYWSYIQADMPGWVEPPGDNPFVAAFPVPEVSVVAGSWVVAPVTIITTEQGEMTQETNTYQTSVTNGQNSSIANTETWDNWSEVSESVETPLDLQQVYQLTGEKNWGKIIGGGAVYIGGEALSCLATGFIETGATNGWAAAACLAGDTLSNVGWDIMMDGLSGDTGSDGISTDSIQNDSSYSPESADGIVSTGIGEINAVVDIDLQGIQDSLDGVQYAINRQGQLLSRGLQDISYQLSRPRFTETRSSGRSWGGAQTTTHEIYEEHTVAEGEAFTTAQNWSTAWAVNSSHAADLTFDFIIENTGTEYAREITGLVFNIFLGDDGTPIVSYPAWEQFNGGKLENVFPGDRHTFSSGTIPLTLEQMKRIDLGEKLTVVMEDYNYGADELFYQNAANGGVTIYIEDGVSDSNELVDMYVIPTWGVETVQDVLARYFPVGVDENGNINSLWTPEFNGVNPPVWDEHFISNIAWWIIYFSQDDVGNTALHELTAAPGSAFLFRFNRDSDRDGYQDRVEDRYDTDKNDPASYPKPEILAGYATTRSGDLVTVTLALENSGTFDAYGVDAVIYAPDDTVTIGNNTVGGNGRVRPGAHVAVGSMVRSPSLADWGNNTASPYAGGNYAGAVDRVYTFTVSTPGVVGQADAALSWSDSLGDAGALDVGSSYHAPLPMDVSQGLQVGFDTGTLFAGTAFTVTAFAPRDTFTYTINSEPYTTPVIVVSYSDPQGSHRFVTPVEIPTLDEDLAPFSGQMYEGLELSIAATAPMTATGENLTNLIVSSPHPETIEGAHLYLTFVADGRLVAELPLTLTIPSGPTVVPVTWSTDVFSETFDPEADNLLIAFWTDAQNNIIDSAARPLNTFATDLVPNLEIANGDTGWDFGAAPQGARLKHVFTLANIGLVDLLTYVETPEELTVSRQGIKRLFPTTVMTLEATLDTATLPLGPYSETIAVRTSDPDKPVLELDIEGTIVASTGDANVFHEDQLVPLQESVFVPGPQGANTQLSYAPAILSVPGIEPLYLHDQDGTVIGQGQWAPDLSDLTIIEANSDQDFQDQAGVENQIQGYSYICDNKSSCFEPHMNSGNWGYITTQSCAYNNHAWWTYNCYNCAEDWGLWRPNLAYSGEYDIELWYPYYQGSVPATNSAHYQVHDRPPGDYFFTWNQATNSCKWARVSTRACNSGTSCYVILTDESHESHLTRRVWFDAVKWVLKPPTTPTLNNISNSDQNGSYEVIWGSIFGATNYILEEDDNSSFSSPTQRYSGSGTSFAVNGQSNGTWYYRVRSQNPAGVSGWSTAKSVSVLLPPAAPALYVINNPSREPNYTVDWSGVPWATGFQLQEDDNAGFSSPVTRYSGSNTHFNVTGQGSGTWYYRVRATNASGNSSWSAVQSTVVSSEPPNVPVSLSPGSGSAMLGRALTLTWQDGGDPDNYPNPYRQFSAEIWNPDTGFSQSLAWTQATSWNVVVPEDGTFYWHVEAYDGEHTSGWTDVHQLDVFSLQKTAPDTINLAIPEDVTAFAHYKVAHGARTVFVSPTVPQVITVRIPKRHYTLVTADAIVPAATQGAVTFTIDVGGDSAESWNQNLTWNTPMLVRSPNLADDFNTYLEGLSAPVGSDVLVPITLHLDTSGELVFTNLTLTPGLDSDAGISAANIGLDIPSPTEGAEVSVQAVVSNTEEYTATNVIAAFFAGDPVSGGVYLGADLLPEIPPEGAVLASIDWDTEGFGGDVEIYVMLDPGNQVDEVDEDNNQASKVVAILTRPDLQVTSVDFSDVEPLQDEPITVTLTISNAGQALAGAVQCELYAGDPGESGELISAQALGSLAGTNATDLVFSWTPTTPGPVRLFAKLDVQDSVQESDERNNETWYDLYVGHPSPLLLDSGAVNEPVYDSEPGYGVRDPELDDAFPVCGSGSEPHETLRRDPGGRLVYRFDHLLPGHFYHLDVTLFECDGAGRQESIYVDGNLITGPEDLGDGQVHRLSIRLDPALYADHAISVTIEAPGIDGAVVSEVNLHDIDYRYADAGGPNDSQYPGALAYGWLDGLANTNWGSMPFQTVRVDQDDNELQYQFDDLDPNKRYNIHFTFWQPSGTGRIQRVRIDGLDTGLDVNLGDYTLHQETVVVAPSTYADDGSIIVSIMRLVADTGAMVNEIALEEETWSLAGACDVPATPYFTDAYGAVQILGTPAPAGTVIEALNPRGDVVGCFVVNSPGSYGYMRIYGEDTSVTPAIPGMRAGEMVEFRVSGSQAVATPLLYWQDDHNRHIVDLNADPIDGQSILLDDGWNLVSFRLESPVPSVPHVLDSVSGRYDRVLGEYGVNVPSLPPVYNTLTELHSGLGYYVHITGTTTINGFFEGATVPVTTPLALHAGWNWIGYLPDVPMPVAQALQSIEGDYQWVLSLDKTYDPAAPQYSTLHELEPGQGYLLFAETAVSLTYPSEVTTQDTLERDFDTGVCESVHPSPDFSLLYGDIMINGKPAPVGTYVEAVTPRGTVAGCLIVEQAGHIGFIHIYGSGPEADPAQTGFREGEPVALRVNGIPLNAPTFSWQNDWQQHRVDVGVDVGQVFLPLVIRGQ